jgi:hypothetical protein
MLLAGGLLLGAQSTILAQTEPPVQREPGLQNAIDALNDRARAYGLVNQAPPGDPSGAVAENFDVIGHNALGAQDSNADVWIHSNFVYVGTWAIPCTGRGVKIIDVSNPRRPRVIGAVGARPGTSAEDVVVRHVSTPYFTGDLLALGHQRCGGQRALDRAAFGVEFWNVTNPYRPQKLASLGVNRGGGGVHELDLFQRGSEVYALLATPFSEFFDPVPGGDFRIVRATNPRAPVQVGEWGAGAHGLAPGPFWGQGSFGASFDHSARASADGMLAYVSYWDQGVLTLDISDVETPTLVTQTMYPAEADGDAHSVSVYESETNGTLLLQNDEDFDPRSPALIHYGVSTGIANESPGATPLWLEPSHVLTADVVEADGQGCSITDYPADTAGGIAVVRTPVPFFDPPGGEEPLCFQFEQEQAAEAAGAAAVVHDFIAENTSPQWFDFDVVGIPVLFTDHATAQGVVSEGSATLEALQPSWGFLRVYDAETGAQVASFDDAGNVHAFPAPDGFWSIHNNEVVGDRSYASWYSNGVVAMDLTPLNETPPQNPVEVGRFIPAGFPEVWGVAMRESDNLIAVSDIGSGLWLVRPTGPAAP